ncbi:MAG TPA: hypothetical protein VER79_09040 [Candidatus Limnocylindrales bacterium]|nr:hypothetical protein [Candidatus Limnocylindrales bacterium]
MLITIHRFRWVLLGVLLLWAATAVSALDLPPAPWYAVAWTQSTDRLHWITAAGEQGSIARPHLVNESDDKAPTDLWISPDGRTLVIATPVEGGRDGIGFYDLASGQWVNTHETQPGERVVSTGAFTPTSSHFAMVVRNLDTGDWRVLAFDTQTGNAVAQLNRGDASIPDTVYDDPAWYPLIASFGIDEGLATLSMRLQQVSVSTDPQTYVGGVPSFRWYPLPPPALSNTPVVPDTLGFSPWPGIDVDPLTGQTVTAATDPQFAAPTAYIGRRILLLGQGQPVTLLTSNAYTLSHPRWLRGTEWIGYRVQNDGVFPPHFAVTTQQGGDGVPLGPNIDELYDTPDGFLAIDTDEYRLLHATDLNIEGFAANFGSVLFQPGVPFSIIYTTPMGAVFGLSSVADPIAPGGLELALPVEACPDAPVARLVAGGSGRVSFTNGQPLNVRTAPEGQLITQLPEGTVFTVENVSPQCAGGYLWWNITTVNGAGWVAEGSPAGYFVEPVTEGLTVATPLGLVPTQAPLGIAVAPTATAAPLPLPVLECIGSPQSRLEVGDVAHTIGSDGTLAMFNAPDDPIPLFQVPYQQTVTIVAGPQCRDGVRMWQVTTTLNNAPAMGWVSEGFGQVYYLQPGPARAL